MPASLLPVPRARFFTAAGLPLAGGKVLTYVAGTTTPLASFTDYSGTIANTNPVILNSVGEANIWLGSGLYKIVLTDANDVVQWTVDNVGQSSVAELAAGFGIATNIASGTTVDLGTLASHFANITGASNISSFGSSATLDAPLYLIKFQGALTINNGANLLTPTGANIVTVAQDRAWVEYLGSGAWRIIDYMRGNGVPLALAVPQVANTLLAGPATGADASPTFRAIVPLDMPAATTSARGAVQLVSGSVVKTAYSQTQTAIDVSTPSLPIDNTIPQSGEGVEVLTQAITPAASANILEIEAVVQLGLNNGGGAGIALFKDSDVNALATVLTNTNVAGQQLNTVVLRFRETAGSTSSRTYRIRAGSSSASCWVNRSQGGTTMGGVFVSSLRVTEILA